MQGESNTDFSDAIERSIRVRRIYHQLEELNHGSHWTTQEDVIGFVNDVGELGRMAMASEGRWLYKGDLEKDLPDKLAECLWWIFVLSEMNELEIDLPTGLEKS